ncbi:WYL domain-containing protein [Leptolyngbya sp. FACHB-711]|nr:WYL domain-containing protein [Leptolyngbya sp. FACHB-711]
MSKYFSDSAFRRLMLLIDTLLQYPGVGYLDKLDNTTEHHNALEEVRKYVLQVAEQRGVSIQCSVHTLHKDLAFLRSLGILGDQMYRWGYYLGTGAMSEMELTIALNALSSQSQYQRDPLVQEIYNKLSKRLKGLASKEQLFYPVRAQLNRSIVETNPVERAARMRGQRNLFDCLETVEVAILKGQKIELGRKLNPMLRREYGTFQVWPLQILHYDIAWYLIYQYCGDGHLAISRIDRLEDKCDVLDCEGRGLSAQKCNLKLAHELLENGWGLFLGNPEDQKQELLGQLELVDIRVRFFPRVMGFVAEGELRHPTQKLEPGPKDPATNKPAYIDYLIKLPLRSIREFNYWIYRFTGNVQVLTPDWLVQEHHEVARQQYERYSQQIPRQ